MLRRNRRETSPRTKRARLFRPSQLIFLALAAVLGVLCLSAKVGAEGRATPPVAAAAPAGAGPERAGPKATHGKDPKDAGAPAALAAPSATAAPDAGPADSDAGAFDYTVIQSDEDFSKDMSDEEKQAIGTGKVPIHREGKYRSVFAHPRFGGPAHVKVGLVIAEIREFNLQSGTFEAEFFLSLTSDKDLPPLSPSFPNGHEVETKAIVDVPTFKLFRVSGKFTTDIDLRRYPFDEQVLDILFEDQLAGVDQLVLEADKSRTSLDATFRVSSFGVASVGAHTYQHRYPPRFDRDDLYISRYKFQVGLHRFAQSAAFSVYVPAFIIVLISLMGMWVAPEELEVRTNAGAPMLAAAVLFHYSLIQSLPATGYLTKADKLMLGVYVSLLLNMGSTWLLLIVPEDKVETTFKLARAWIPPFTGLVMTAASIL